MMRFLKSILSSRKDQSIQALENKVESLSKKNEEIEAELEKTNKAISELTYCLRSLAVTNQSIYADIVFLTDTIGNMGTRTMDDDFAFHKIDDDDGYLN